MKKQLVLLVMTLVFTISLCGVVSAAQLDVAVENNDPSSGDVWKINSADASVTGYYYNNEWEQKYYPNFKVSMKANIGNADSAYMNVFLCNSDPNDHSYAIIAKDISLDADKNGNVEYQGTINGQDYYWKNSVVNDVHSMDDVWIGQGNYYLVIGLYYEPSYYHGPCVSIGKNIPVTIGSGNTNNKYNHPPMANAGPDQYCYVGATVYLRGFGYDVDWDSLDYKWINLPSVDPINLNNSPLFAFTPTAPGLYTFQFIVNDGNGGVATDEVRVYVTEKPKDKISRAISSISLWNFIGLPIPVPQLPQLPQWLIF